MKHSVLTFVFACIASSMMAQMPNLPQVPDRQKPLHPIGTIYNGYMLSMSNSSNMWKGDSYVPKYYLVKDEANYYLGIELRNHDDFIEVTSEMEPTFVLTADDGSEVALKCFEERPVIYCFTYTGSGSTNDDGYFLEAPVYNYFSSHVLYCIPDIDAFMAKKYTKVKALGTNVDHDYAAGGDKEVEKFNAYFATAKKTVDKNYNIYATKISKLSETEKKATLEYYITNDKYKWDRR